MKWYLHVGRLSTLPTGLYDSILRSQGERKQLMVKETVDNSFHGKEQAVFFF
jgi:hypothetical protein